MLDLSKVTKLAITGANGFVGKSIVDHISNLPQVNMPNELCLITRKGLNFKLEDSLVNRTSEVHQNLTEKWRLPRDITHVLNLAADGSRSPYSSEACRDFEKISKNLVSWISSAGEKVTVFHASSGACFGRKPLDGTDASRDIKEEFITNRIKVENILAESSTLIGFDLRVGRLFTFAGINLLGKPQYALNDFIDMALKDGKIVIRGNPKTQRSYLHQTDMSVWILKTLINDEPYVDLQIGSNEVVTLEALAEYVAKETNAVVETSGFLSNGDIYVPENSATRTKLGVVETIDWKNAVSEMISEARINS